MDEQTLGDLDHSVTHPRANIAEGRVDKDKNIQNLDLPNPAELKNNVTALPAAILLTVCCRLLYSFKQLKRVCRTQRPPILLRCMETRGEHVHQTFTSLPPHVRSSRGLPSTHSFTQALSMVRFSILYSGISH